MNLIVYLSIVLLLVLMIPVAEARSSLCKGPTTELAQSTTIDSVSWYSSGKKIPLFKLGKCIIYEKDGSQIRNLILKEIHDHWIVYEKDGSLHDMMIEKIHRISVGLDNRYSVYFDDDKKPYIKMY